MQDTLGILDNFFTTELAVTIYSIHKGDGNLADRISLRLCCDGQRHLHGEPSGVGALKQLLQHAALIQSEAASQIADARAEHGVGKDVCALAGELALQIPAIYTSITGISGAGDDIVVTLGALGDHLRDELGVMAEVGIHDYDVVPLRELESVNICGAEAELSSPCLQLHMWRIGLDQLLCDILSSVGRAVIDDYEFPVDISMRLKTRG